MNRRSLLSLIGGAAAWPVAARAQQPAMPIVGYLNGQSPDTEVTAVAAFRQGLTEAGFVDGRNVVIELHFAKNQPERLPMLAADLVRRQVAVIVTNGIASALAAKAATTTIPIVFSTGGDPVNLGLVSSLNRPGGNLTGATNLGNALATKELQLMHELVPSAEAIAYLANPNNPNAESDTADVHAAARVLGLQVQVLNASTPGGIDTAFATLAQQRAGAVLIGVDPFLNGSFNQLAALAARYGVPTIGNRTLVAAGGLMSYRPGTTDGFRQVGVYTGRVLKGEKPADLPVVQSTKFTLVINSKTAKVLDLTIPPGVLAIADEVIE
jgi:putative tryptophan/tyrosine transport system substrate-binding protein